VLGLIGSGHFRGGVAEIAGPLVENLTHSDPFLVLADYGAYVACQGPVSAAWSDQERWTRMSILSTAGCGKFSSYRAIREYCDDIWDLKPAPVKVNGD
jgi:starch phosphorylase